MKEYKIIIGKKGNDIILIYQNNVEFEQHQFEEKENYTFEKINFEQFKKEKVAHEEDEKIAIHYFLMNSEVRKSKEILIWAQRKDLLESLDYRYYYEKILTTPETGEWSIDSYMEYIEGKIREEQGNSYDFDYSLPF